jgi:hypothetical protein
MKVYGLLNQVSNDWVYGPYSYKANLFLSIRRSYDFDKQVYCRSIELQVALVDNDLFCPETWLSFTISPFKVALAILKESEILNKDIVLSLISWDKLEENDGKTDEI